MRQVVDALRYVCRTGCQWRSLPVCFPPWSAVCSYFARWQTTGLVQRLNGAANRADRLARHRLPAPSLAPVDAQSVKLAPRVGGQRGRDARKRVNGRKRQVRCAAGRRRWRVHAHAANGHDSRAARPWLPFATQLRPAWASRLRRVLTGKAYCGQLAHRVQALGGQHHVASRPPSAARGFVPVAQRWVVERTFAWRNCFRRLAVDYEPTTSRHAAWLLVANLTMALQRATAC